MKNKGLSVVDGVLFFCSVYYKVKICRFYLVEEWSGFLIGIIDMGSDGFISGCVVVFFVIWGS